MSTEHEEVIGTQQAAETLGVSVRTVQLWVENGSLKAWKTPGKHRRILLSSVEALLAERAGQQAGRPASKAAARDDVLIVEDEVTMQAYYEAMFELLRPELNLRFADNGFAGLVEYGRKTPALMLVDIDMPGMDGVEMIKALDAHGHSDARIVVVSSLSEEQIEERGGIRDGIPVLGKPVGVEALEYILDNSFGAKDGAGE